METNEARPRTKGAPERVVPERVVKVDRSKYDELLVSRRRLERVDDRDDRLRDRDTHEVFVVDESAEIGMARNA